MFDDEDQDRKSEQASSASVRAAEKLEEIQMYAQLYAIYEGPRKFEAEVVPGLDGELTRDVQRGMARLAKSRESQHPILPADSIEPAHVLLRLCVVRDLTTNDYHVHRRPGEVMMIRWLAGEQVESFYDRMQAHFDVGLQSAIDEEANNAWKGGESTQAYLDELEKQKNSMSHHYLRPLLRRREIVALSTLSADAINIEFLCGHVMNVGCEAVVGPRNAPKDGARESQLSWYFKLFALRSHDAGTDRMCFFTYLQKSEDDEFDDQTDDSDD